MGMVLYCYSLLMFSYHCLPRPAQTISTTAGASCSWTLSRNHRRTGMTLYLLEQRGALPRER
uniref:Uncharacterized protein n=1 Tax=Anguilla anguilla TaxID=7936 RepID=A0A0E9RQU8_ANGAN